MDAETFEEIIVYFDDLIGLKMNCRKLLRTLNSWWISSFNLLRGNIGSFRSSRAERTDMLHNFATERL